MPLCNTFEYLKIISVFLLSLVDVDEVGYWVVDLWVQKMVFVHDITICQELENQKKKSKMVGRSEDTTRTKYITSLKKKTLKKA